MWMIVIWIVLIVVVVLGLFIAVLAVIRKDKKSVKKDYSYLIQLFQKDNVQEVHYLRNKIVVDFVNVDFFDAEALKDAGAKGISIVGDRIKFFIDGSTNENEDLFLQLKEYLER